MGRLPEEVALDRWVLEKGGRIVREKLRVQGSGERAARTCEMKVTDGMIPVSSGDSAHRKSWDRSDMLPVNATQDR